ncbi:MAG: hypothetical protein D6696_01315 [Acidobacteria bacterium]|nr:MAG: hypothetical protein D6696_01315 [Acidobacteriota bacterium]
MRANRIRARVEATGTDLFNAGDTILLEQKNGIFRFVRQPEGGRPEVFFDDGVVPVPLVHGTVRGRRLRLCAVIDLFDDDRSFIRGSISAIAPPPGEPRPGRGEVGEFVAEVQGDPDVGDGGY